MRSRIIGIGYSKTGTSTLRACFRHFGLCHIGFDIDLTKSVVDGDAQPALDALANYEAADNWPWPLIYPQIDNQYPDTRFVLTVRRDSTTWIKSLISQANKKPDSVYREWVYGHRNPMGNERELIRRYELHNHEVRRYFAPRPELLLEVCWENGSGWPELCRFLELPIPNVPFPHANRSTKPVVSFRRRLGMMLGLSRHRQQANR